MSTIVFSNQSSIFFTIFSVGSDQIQHHTEPENRSHTRSHLKPTTDVLHGENQDHAQGQTPRQDPEVHQSHSRGIGGIQRSSWLPYRGDQK